MRLKSSFISRGNLAVLGSSLMIVAALTGCSASGPDSSTTAEAVANIACREADVQLESLVGGEEISIQQCESQSNSTGEDAFVIRLNDPNEWQRLLVTRPIDEVLFIIPLALIAYSFGGSSQDPDVFDRILVVFDDPDQTVYDFTSSDLRKVLGSMTQQEAEAELQDLARKMRITTMR